jgi:hypothetical protein
LPPDSIEQEKVMSRATGKLCSLSAAALAVLVGCGSPTNEATTDQPAPALETKSSTEAPADTQAASSASVYFIAPANGDTVTNPVTVEFGIAGMSVVPAGQDTPQSGHHHLIIDAPLPDLSLPVPKNANYVHFGDGSSSTELTLEAGEHTLQLLFADFLHIPHEPAVKSETITIIVE